MNTGIKIKGGGGHTLSWNLIIGADIGIDIEDSWNNLLEGNIYVSEKVIGIYGPEFKDVLLQVQKSKDFELLLAIGNIINSEPDNAITGWEILIRNLGINIGSFSVSILSGVLSNSAYNMLKLALSAHGINLP